MLDVYSGQDLAFTLRERESLGLKGLLPPAIRSQELQVKTVIETIRAAKDQLSKYLYLRDLQDYNERLFYRVLCLYTEELMPIVYTPVVGEACIKFSHIYKRPRGLYITVHDAGHIHSILSNWPEKNVKAICVTDGERILGLGDLGANGMGIPIGKLSLYTALAGVPPYLTVPITIDVGTNNETFLNDPYYIGLKQKRVRGPQYDDLLDEFMEAVVKKWGRSCLIQFEDFANANAFRLLEKYKNNFCTFNDDIQGTASVAVAGIICSARLTGMKLSQNKFLFLGAGEAAIGIADFIVMAMKEEGLSEEEALERIYMIDSRGLITVDRPAGGVEGHKIRFAKAVEHCKELENVIDMLKPTALIGVSAQHKSFNETVLKKMASYNKRPLIFALSNPTSKAECTAEEAYTCTEGRCVFASGSPFDPVTINGQTFHPGQGNNAYIFPGVALAVMACNVHHIPDETFLVAAKALADLVSKEHIAQGRVYPPLQQIREVCLQVAAKVAQYFFVESLATLRPEPEDKLLFMRGKQYNCVYDQVCNNNYV
ncbi:NADP-dependent malic enzyme-like protein [Dinothrombium tinctorium]|uniref:Malic enzyme n=1 Tax=Dinothrombium tinctorium TaxID=1965070 RepID=A0A443R493_9ACAR|nr:NADP-dependent malic enzyme-like protein [Dinothrombium tinctorium]